MEVLTIGIIRDLHHEIKKALSKETGKPKLIKNFSQIQIIYYLVSNKDKVIYQKDIVDALKLKKSSITEHLDYLESVGLIERKQDPVDKRKNSIVLSDEALKKENEIEDIIRSINEKAIKGLSLEEIEQLEKTVKKMEDNLKQ